MHEGSVTIQELVETTALGRAVLRAGEGGLGQEVRRVQWMEVLDDFAEYLSPGDLLLTTAYNLRDQPELQRRLAGRMQEAGVVAMVVKCGYYLDDIPYPVRRQADELAMPLFELPRETAFVEISQSIYERLVSRSYARLRRAADIHRELVRLVLEGATLGRIVRRAAVLLDHPVAVEDAAGRPLASALPSGAAASLEPGAIERHAGALAVPIVARGLVHGRVALLPRRPLGPDDDQALEQVATVIALELARSEQELRDERERRTALTEELLRGGDPEQLRRRAAALRLELPAGALVVVSPEPAGVPSTPLRAELDGLFAAVTGSDRAPAGPGGMAACGGGWEGVAEAYRRARRAWTIGSALRGARGLHRYEDVETHDALLGDLEGERLEQVRRRVLDPLSPELRATVAAYLDSGGSAAAAARASFVHRNTVHYRLRRVRELTGLDLARSEDRLLCQLALLAGRVTESRSATTSSDAASPPAGAAPTPG